jgi:eukaryotic-like serine/threonine-protein kinase
MLTDDALTFARVALELNILSQEQLLSAIARWGAEGGRDPLRTHLVRSGLIDEEQARTVARASVFRPSTKGLQGTGYEIGDVLGRGANGVVHLATDTSLRREVALKMHSKGAEISNVDLLRFTHEAQVTGQLGHPGVVPVHDLGTLPDGRPYYTMRKIGGSSLKEIFAGLKAQEPELVARWTLTHMVVVLLRVAQALAFAHDRGVIHRDVKPANIMAGDYGEVLILDWGVARVLGESRDGSAPVDTWRSVGGEDLTVDGTIAGTPAYMAPEQARGDIDTIGPAADVYSVGVILYEFLCGKRPFRARNIQGLLDMVVADTIIPISQRELKHRLPVELEALCMRCLSKDQKQRFANGGELAAALEGFLEGSRKQEQAEKLTNQGLERLGDYKRASDWARDEEDKLRSLEADLPPWSGANERRTVWQQSASWGQQRKKRDDIYDEASTLLQGALQYAPGHQPAQKALAQLFFRRLVEAEERGEKNAARFFREQVRLHDATLLSDNLTDFSLTIEPRGARATLFRLSEQDRVLGPEQSTPLQSTPITNMSLEGGSYTLRLECEGHIPVTTAIHTGASRGDRAISLTLRLPRIDEVARGFAVVPAGSFYRGGDPLSIDGQRASEIEMQTFAIGRHPVTQSEFGQWLESGDAPAGTLKSFHWWNELNEVPQHERDSVPALGVPIELAEAYARWRSTETGFRLRLPAHDEWEKAARGVDGRVFPWGNSWVPTYCNGPEGFADKPRPRPVGSPQEDCSVYGVRDLAGGVCEWVAGAVPHRPDRGWLRGGSWRSHPRHARICSRSTLPRNSRDRTVGFRLVQDLDV